MNLLPASGILISILPDLPLLSSETLILIAASEAPCITCLFVTRIGQFTPELPGFWKAKKKPVPIERPSSQTILQVDRLTNRDVETIDNPIVYITQKATHIINGVKKITF